MWQFHESLPSAGGKAQSLTLDSVRRTSHPARWTTTLLWFSVLVGLPEMHGRSVSSQASQRAWSRYDGGRQSGDRHVGRGHRRGARAQRYTGGRTVGLGAVPAGSTGRTEPEMAAVPSDGHGVRADEGHRRRRHLGSRSTTPQWARSGWRATPHSNPGRDSGAQSLPPGCLALNGRTGR